MPLRVATARVRQGRKRQDKRHDRTSSAACGKNKNPSSRVAGRRHFPKCDSPVVPVRLPREPQPGPPSYASRRHALTALAPHRRHAEWTTERIGREAAAIGPATAALTAIILLSRPHPEQGFRACLGILRLLRTYGRDRLEAACARGIEIGARSYGSIQSILQHGLDRQAAPRPARDGDELPLLHPNIRGAGYYH
jgi:hypothetical protein